MGALLDLAPYLWPEAAQAREPAQLQPLNLEHPFFKGSDWFVYCNGIVYTPDRPYGVPVAAPDAAMNRGGIARGILGSRAQRVVAGNLFGPMPRTVLLWTPTGVATTAGTATQYIGISGSGAGLNLGTGTSGGPAGRRSVAVTGGVIDAPTVYQVGSFTGTDWAAWQAGSSRAVTYTGSGATYSGAAQVQFGWGGPTSAYETHQAIVWAATTAVLDAATARDLSINPRVLFAPAPLVVTTGEGAAASVTLPGAQALADAGSTAALGGAGAAVAGASCSATAGPVGAVGGAAATMPWATGTGAAGLPVARGGASATVTGAAAAATRGTVSAAAGAGAVAVFAGAAAAAQAGVAGATGGAVALPAGSAGTASAGTVTASSGSGAAAVVSGVAAVAAAGVPTGRGGAQIVVPGLLASATGAGVVATSGGATAVAAGAAAAAAPGVLAGRGGAQIVVPGLLATASAGVLSATGAVAVARAVLAGVAAAAAAGATTARGGAQAALPTGAMAGASVGRLAALGARLKEPDVRVQAAPRVVRLRY